MKAWPGRPGKIFSANLNKEVQALRNIASRIREIGGSRWQEIQRLGAAGIPLGLRFFLFLVVLLLTIFLGVVAILLLTGTFTAGLSEKERFLESELSSAAVEIKEQYGQISLLTTELAEVLSRNLEMKASRLGVSLGDLDRQPQLLEELISGVYDEALLALLLARSSGVFLILDGTVNPALEGAANSKAGLYIKNMEPNVLSATSPNIILLRGFPGISRRKALPLHAQWCMEFDVIDAPYYHRIMEAASHLPRSRLYFWSEALVLPGTNEEVMLCAAPLLDSGGRVFGVCGLEISSMLFKLAHMPDNTDYQRLFCLLAPFPAGAETIELRRSLFAGGYSARMISGEGGEALQISKGKHLHTYRQGRGSVFLGLHSDVQLYPRDSPFAGERWIVALALPEKDIMSSVIRLNITLFASLMLLVILGLALSFGLSKRIFVKPISHGLAMLRSVSGEMARTRIPEIDDLIDYLAQRDRELAEEARRENLSIDTLNLFLKRLEELTAAEREVFKLYAEGYTAREIASALYLSINTIKTHSKHIYMKLEITSRAEIILYVTLLREIGVLPPDG